MAPSMDRPKASNGTLELDDDIKPRWRSHWLACCGSCTATDIISCCTAHLAPCVAYGWTTSRVFRTSFWKEAGKFLLLWGTYYLLDFALTTAKLSTCPLPPDQASAAALDAAAVATPTAGATAAPRTPACITLTILSSGMVHLAFLICIVWAVWIGGPRRTQLRQHLRIASRGAGGDCCTDWPIGDRGSSSDCCLHYWCLWCALAQEMRTVMHLQALNKLPMGPAEGYEPLVTQAVAPGVNGDMSRVQKVPLATMV